MGKVRWCIAIALAVGMVLAQPAFASAAVPEAAVRVAAKHPVPGKYLVTLAPTAAQGYAAYDLTKRFGGNVESVLTATMNGFVVSGLPERAARQLAAAPGVLEVRQSGRASIGGTQDNPPNWGLDRIDQRDRPVDRKYTYPNDGSGVTVYVADTGIRFTHQEFEGRASFGVDLHAQPNQGNDCNNHGTHVSGIAAGKTRGVAKKAKLVSVRILGCDGYGEDVDLIEAAEWITKNGTKPSVVNLSVYTDDKTIAVNALKGSIAAGFQWSLITGNNGGNACNYGPGGQISEGLQVANATSSDTRASDSNSGSCMDLFAPGSGIDSSFRGSDSAYGQLSGTSMAAPHVAGAMALRLHDAPSSSPADLHKWVMDNASTGKMSGLSSDTPNKLLYVPNAPPTGEPTARFSASCPAGSLSCSFDGSGSTGSISSWKWDFGDGKSGEGKTVDHAYAGAGTYTVKLTVTDNSGKTATTEQQVKPGDTGSGQPPTASFTLNCQAGLSCAFDGSASSDPDGSISSYAWDFGDGSTGSGKTTTHAYPSRNGTYTAKLTVTDNSGATGSAQRQVQCWSFGTGQGFCFAN